MTPRTVALQTTTRLGALWARGVEPGYRGKAGLQRERRMWCLADKRSLRISFIAFFKKLMATARAVRERWRQGDISVRYPPGLFPPSMPKLANVFRA